MPPWAHTECDRFTGTTDIRSTSWPASAIFIAAARPARPPPTIAIFNPAFAIGLTKTSASAHLPAGSDAAARTASLAAARTGERTRTPHLHLPPRGTTRVRG